MEYKVDVYILKGKVRVGVDAKSPAEAENKAIKQIENAEAGYHGNYPAPDKKYLAVIAEK